MQSETEAKVLNRDAGSMSVGVTGRPRTLFCRPQILAQMSAPLSSVTLPWFLTSLGGNYSTTAFNAAISAEFMSIAQNVARFPCQQVSF